MRTFKSDPQFQIATFNSNPDLIPNLFSEIGFSIKVLAKKVAEIKEISDKKLKAVGKKSPKKEDDIIGINLRAAMKYREEELLLEQKLISSIVNQYNRKREEYLALLHTWKRNETHNIFYKIDLFYDLYNKEKEKTQEIAGDINKLVFMSVQSGMQFLLDASLLDFTILSSVLNSQEKFVELIQILVKAYRSEKLEPQEILRFRRQLFCDLTTWINQLSLKDFDFNCIGLRIAV